MDVLLDGEIHVSLSERNLRDLLMQFEAGGNDFLDGGKNENSFPARAQLVRVCSQPTGANVFLRVTVQDDKTHYGGRTPGPGVWGDKAKPDEKAHTPTPEELEDVFREQYDIGGEG